MIYIKKILLFTLLLIFGATLILVFSNINKKPAKPIDQILLEQKLEDDEIEQEDENEENIEVSSEDEIITEQVKDFISDKTKKAIEFFSTSEIQMVAIGDSLTQGVGDETKEGGYVGILEQTINSNKRVVDIQSFGKNGNRSSQLLKRLDEPEIIEAIEVADIVLVTVGANDIMQVFKENFTNLKLEQFTSEQVLYEQRLELILSIIQEMNSEAEIYLLGFYNPFEYYFADIEELIFIINNWNQIGLDVTNKFDQITFIPIKDLFGESSIDLIADDNFHPNHQGYELIAERVLQYLMKEEGE